MFKWSRTYHIGKKVFSNMKRILASILFSLTLSASVYGYSLFEDRKALETGLLRLHVVANSDSEEDQTVKLQVRDQVLSSICAAMEQAGNMENARAYLAENLPEIEAAANRALKAAGCEELASVTLCKEEFTKRIYDTFALPAGLYEALRITIGEGKGHNWWCVAYPQLCVPASSGEVETAALEAGLPETLRGAMTGRYQIRFFLLDLLGRLR